MSDLTTFDQAVPNPTSNMGVSEDKGNKIGKILVAILVLVILGEAGYFFYNRYVSSGGKLPFKNLSTGGTMNYQADQSPAPQVTEPVDNPSKVSQVGGLDRDKADSTIETIFGYPEGFVIDSSINVTIEGKVVALVTDTVELENKVTSHGLRLVNPKGEPIGVRFFDEEMDRMRVVVVDKGQIVREATYLDIKPGDMVDIKVSSDLMDLRRGVDNITIEIRTY